MNGELLAVLEHMEREKGIKKDILIDAVEQALASAVRKIADIKPGIEVKVTLDRETGKLKAFAGEEEIRSEGLGRIAARMAASALLSLAAGLWKYARLAASTPKMPGPNSATLR